MKEVGVSVVPPMAAEAWSMVETTCVSSVTCRYIFNLGLYCELADRVIQLYINYSSLAFCATPATLRCVSRSATASPQS